MFTQLYRCDSRGYHWRRLTKRIDDIDTEAWNGTLPRRIETACEGIGFKTSARLVLGCIKCLR